jgi:hypothetical protein
MVKYVFFFMMATLSSLSQATLISSIPSLKIGDFTYDVTFHTSPETFNTLWTSSYTYDVWDGSFGRAPTFWENRAGARLAALEITEFLGDTFETIPRFDGFYIPFQSYAPHGSTAITAFGDLDYATDQNSTPDYVGAADISRGRSYPYHALTSFELIERSAVPSPSISLLLMAGLIGILTHARFRYLRS